jgi:uncharacterized protein (TIGR00255 family)
MTFASMTGFAESTGSHEGLRWRWEVKSVNSRSLDLRLRIPPGYDGLEPPVRRLASERFLRGALQVSLSIETPAGAGALAVDPVALASAIKIARELAAETGLAPARIDGLLALKGVIVADDGIPALDPLARGSRDAALLESLGLAFDKLTKERAREGAKLAQLLKAQVEEIERLVADAAGLAATQPETLKARLKAQIADMLEQGSIAEDRLAQEVALLAVKADVREELDRLTAHVQDARALVAQGKGVGRKLDFLAQEFNREANTLCSKSADIALTRNGLALKAVIDQFREQAQNVE